MLVYVVWPCCRTLNKIMFRFVCFVSVYRISGNDGTNAIEKQHPSSVMTCRTHCFFDADNAHMYSSLINQNYRVSPGCDNEVKA